MWGNAFLAGAMAVVVARMAFLAEAMAVAVAVAVAVVGMASLVVHRHSMASVAASMASLVVHLRPIVSLDRCPRSSLVAVCTGRRRRSLGSLPCSNQKSRTSCYL